jgi:predicted aldo/keto reductase-like oxidoreductase
MQKLKKEGRIKHIGVSTHRNEPEVIRAAADSGVYEVVLTAYNFRQKHRAEVESAISYAAQKGLGIVAMKTQAGVYWDKEKQYPINMKAALKWALKNPNVHTAIPGFTTFDQLELDVSVMENLTMTPQEEKDLKKGEELKLAGLYCQQCDACVTQCKKGLDIPTFMRAHMYAFGYRNLQEAQHTYRSVGTSADACRNCSTCTVRCTSGFDIRERMLNIAKIDRVPEEFLV